MSTSQGLLLCPCSREQLPTPGIGPAMPPNLVSTHLPGGLPAQASASTAWLWLPCGQHRECRPCPAQLIKLSSLLTLAHTWLLLS